MESPIRYNRHTIRLKEYDYSQKGKYFITICTHQRKKVLGKINNKFMEQDINNISLVGAGLASAQEDVELTDIGRIVNDGIIKLQEEFSIEINSYIIMPNHIHMIINNIDCKRADARPAPTLGDIICSFKSRTAMKFLEINKRKNIQNQKLWQRNYYEHIIRNEKELYEIMEYIEYNPFNWKIDPLNTE